LLIGTGETHYPLPYEFIKYFMDRGISVESMKSKHAATTFNLLNSENRNVAAAIVAVEPINAKEVTPETDPVLINEIYDDAKKQQSKKK
jgi:hypothetical protein